MRGWAWGSRLPSRPFESVLKLYSRDFSLSDDVGVCQHDGDAPVVQAEKFFVGVDIGEVGFMAELPE
jgi:hypothetical protein